MSKPTLITVTYNTWSTYTERLIRMVEHFTNSDSVQGWLICDNGSHDAAHLKEYKFKLKTEIALADANIGDLPRYDCFIPYLDGIVIAISTDVRIFGHDWIDKFLAPFSDPEVGMVGHFGPGAGMTPAHADPSVGGVWHWIPKLLVDRRIEFDDCHHIQTHMFAVRTEAFKQAGGFWTPENWNFLDKGNLIAGEIAFSVRLRALGWKLDNHIPDHYHYGNQAASQMDLDQFDRNKGWEVPF